MIAKKIPAEFYGVAERDNADDAKEQARESVLRKGYSLLDSGYSQSEINALKEEFDLLSERYIQHFGEEKLRVCDEINTMRAPLLFEQGTAFLDLALNPVLIEFVGSLISGKFILNQQNGIINPSREGYNQGRWHRDLPYQHFVVSRPIAVNALFCIDDFTFENGSTFVLPFSHRRESLPSESYIRENAVQVQAAAGQYIILDCMLYHAGGFNNSLQSRRAVNHVFNIPFFKQQIKVPGNISPEKLSVMAKEVLGLNYEESPSVDDYIKSRLQRC